MIKENTNKAIAINSIIMYIRLLFISIIGLLTTRFALEALGVVNFGLFSVVGSVITFIGFINTVMISTSNRYIAVAIGKNNPIEMNKAFNVNFIIHLFIALFTLLIAYPVGNWYILNFIQFDGDINTAVQVYNITVLGSILAFVGVPFNGLLMAKEKFIVFCLTDIVVHIFKAIFTYLLLFYFSDKLMAYAIIVALTTSVPTIVFIIYCYLKFPIICRFKFICDKAYYLNIFSFSGWVAYGALAYVAKSQGGALIVNMFFNTIMNTALGIANSVNSILLMFSNNITKSISPQITKSYSSGNFKRAEELTINASRYSFFIMLVCSIPLLVAPNLIYGLWLGKVPEFVVLFSSLIIVDTLINSLNIGVVDIVFASGKIKKFQFIINTILLFSIIIAYIALKNGFPAYYLQIVYILFTVVTVIIRQVLLKHAVEIDNKKYLEMVFFPAFIISILNVPIYFLKDNFSELLLLILSMLYEFCLIYIIGLSKSEKNKLNILLLKLIRYK